MAPKTAEAALPPAYNTLRPSDEEIAAIEARWERNRPEAKICCCKVLPHTKECVEQYNVTFACQPKILQTMSLRRLSRDRKAHPAWRALLILKAPNLPRLMRRGFSWSPANLVRGDERISLDSKSLGLKLERSFASQWGWTAREGGWIHQRHYHIRDTGPDTEWHGTLMVFGRKPSTVINFDVSSIDIDTVVWAMATNWHGQVVYDTRRGPDESFNTIYHRLPLRGWWPWPKEPQGDINKPMAEDIRKGTQEEKGIGISHDSSHWNIRKNPCSIKLDEGLW